MTMRKPSYEVLDTIIVVLGALCVAGLLAAAIFGQ